MFPHMSNKQSAVRIRAVKRYIDGSDSLRAIAPKIGVYYSTLCRWVKLYRTKGPAALLSTYRRPWNRSSSEFEERIVTLKEHDPTITLRRARELLADGGTMVSVKRIWGIWQRYGYAGFDKRRLDPNPSRYTLWSKEARDGYAVAVKLHEAGQGSDAAQVLNSIPMLPANELLLQIPDQHLNLRRRIEKSALLYKKAPLPAYLENVKSLYEQCGQARLQYSRLKVGLLAVGAQSFLGRPIELLATSQEVGRILRPRGPYFSNLLFVFKFTLLTARGLASASALEINKTDATIRECCVLMKSRKTLPAEFPSMVGTMCAWIQDYRRAQRWFNKALNRARGQDRFAYRILLAITAWHKGDYRQEADIYRRIKRPIWGLEARVFASKAARALADGRPDEAILLSSRALESSRKEDLNEDVCRNYVTIAGAYCALGKNTDAGLILKRLSRFARERSSSWGPVIEIIAGSVCRRELQQSSGRSYLPMVRLASLLKLGRYEDAMRLAQRKYLITSIHALVLHFPETIVRCLARGRATGLPRSLLRLPVFNRQASVYNIRLLGDLVVYRDEQYVRCRLAPKDAAFLVSLGFKIDEPGKRVAAEEVYANFWPGHPNPGRNLAHLLVRIRRALRIPAHRFGIVRRSGQSWIVNRGVYFTSDYREFGYLLAGAGALQRAGEWEFARRDFLRAFRLLRGEVLAKMYDAWSVDLRNAIIGHVESEAKKFIAGCREHGRLEDILGIGRRVLRVAAHLREVLGMAAGSNT